MSAQVSKQLFVGQTPCEISSRKEHQLVCHLSIDATTM